MRSTPHPDLPNVDPSVVLPDIQELLASAVVVRIPLSLPFRGISHREAVLLRGPLGWAEFAPFTEYADAEASRWLLAAIEGGWYGWPAPVRDSVGVNATVPAVPAAQVPGVLARFPGCTTAKVKVAQRGQGLMDDLDRVAAVRAHLGPAARVRVDANAGWDLTQARDALIRLSAYDLEYAEQPVAEVPDLARLRRTLAADGVSVPIAADESIRRAQDPIRIAREQAADLVVVKVAPLGGVRAALRIVAQCGLPAVVSSALDTSVGIAAGVALAAALPDLRHDCGLGTVALLQGDVTGAPLRPAQGLLTLDAAHRALAGVRAELMEQHRADPGTAGWWLARLARCRALLGEPRPEFT
ncbi:MAG: o-succinylbenzoate synthase [Ornithinimicrobium sp.]|uniref:o-succinylbenzoate synthase n=1 Tax=Ornithinimicrobium sp. TaxID=1977084 RepID=UPI003D9B0FA2